MGEMRTETVQEFLEKGGSIEILSSVPVKVERKWTYGKNFLNHSQKIERKSFQKFCSRFGNDHAAPDERNTVGDARLPKFKKNAYKCESLDQMG